MKLREAVPEILAEEVEDKLGMLQGTGTQERIVLIVQRWNSLTYETSLTWFEVKRCPSPA